MIQNQPYSFWVTASTMIGEGPESDIVSETPQSPVPAAIATVSQEIIKAVKEEARLECKAIGQPTPRLDWSYKYIYEFD